MVLTRAFKSVGQKSWAKEKERKKKAIFAVLYRECATGYKQPWIEREKKLDLIISS